MEILKQYGLLQNTLVIVTSDNGAVRGSNGHKSEVDYRGYKGNIWDGGHRIPFIASWPGKIKPGSVSSEVISLSDMFATFAGLVSYRLSNDEGEDSHNVLPSFFGRQQDDSDTRVRVFHSAGGYFAIQKGQWKLIDGTKGSGSGKQPFPGDPVTKTGQLYNIAEDPFETNDLWELEPGIVNELEILLETCKSGGYAGKIIKN
jgi:arylsulfatase A-like enzyme